MKNHLCLTILVLLSALFTLQASAVTEQDIKDAVLGRKTFTDTELQAMDLNGDGKVDVADAVMLLKIPDDEEIRFAGTMIFDTQYALAPQHLNFSVDETSSEAVFTVEDSPFFPAGFRMSGTFSADALAFTSQGTGVYPDGDMRNPVSNPISYTLNINAVTPVSVGTSDEKMFQAAFVMTYTGFRSDSKPLPVTGTLYLHRQSAGEGLSFKDAGSMNLLVQKYGIQ